MAVYNVHAGHNAQVSGAQGFFSETKENREVKNRVIALLRQQGHTVYDCTDDVGRNQLQNLRNIVRKCNAHKVDLDISIHFNASNGSGNGTEVLCYNSGTHGIAARICDRIAALGFRNRGVKNRPELYVLNGTKAQAILVECCFCDNAKDAALYRADAVAKAIVAGITGKAAGEKKSVVPATPVVQKDAGLAGGVVSFTYAVMLEGGKTLPEVTNLQDYAGLRGQKITGIKMRCNRGSLWYQVHVLGGGWLGRVTGCDWQDYWNGYAGNGKVIDAVRVYYNTPPEIVAIAGYQKARYRVSPVGGNYFPWQYDNETGKGQDGYAGLLGRAMDRFQLY